jgi:hypothetical protein
MEISIKQVISSADLKKFIYLPSKIHRKHKNWVPPVYNDEKIFFNPKKNKAFQYSDTVMFLAFVGKKTVGRIMGIVHHKYNQKHNLREVRFSFLESYDDFNVSEALLKKVEDWGRKKDMSKLVGPLAFSDKDPQGLLVEGFNEPIVIASNCNFPYLVNFMDRYGFNKKTDLVVYQIIIPEKIPSFYERIAERALRNNPKLRLADIRNRKDIKKYVRPVFHLINETFTDIYAFTPMEEKEMDEFAKRYILILDPKYLVVLLNEKEEVVAFVLGMPDINEGVKKSKGKLFPFGFIHILRAQKKTKQLSLLLGAIRKDYRNSGLDAVLGKTILKNASKAGLKYLDSHLELETNIKVRAEMEKMGGQVYKRFRIYEKDIS